MDFEKSGKYHVVQPGSPQRKHNQQFIQYVAATAVSLGCFSAGTSIGWTSPILPQFTENSNITTNLSEPAITLSETQTGAVGGALLLGAMVSSIPTGYLADKIGRKPVTILTSLLLIVQWTLIIFAQNYIFLIIARFIGGIGLGAINVIVSTYIAEIAETCIRGRLGSFVQLFLSSGILVAYIVGTYTNWRLFSTILLIFSIIFGISCLFIPESPYYLVQKQRIVKAEIELKKLRGGKYEVGEELILIQKEIEDSQKKSVKLKNILSIKSNRKALLCILSLFAFQQFNGICAVTFYAVSIFQSSGSNLSAEIVSIIIASLELLGSAISTVIMEKRNRKFYLILSSLGMFISLLALGIYFHLKSLDVNINSIRFIPTVSAIFFMGFFGLGYGGIPFLLMSEMFSPEIKGCCTGFAILIGWLCAFIVTFLYPILDNILGTYVLFYFFSIVMVIATIFVYFVVPETRGKSLAEIQRMLSK